MGKYKVLKNVESAKGGKFFKDEVVEGTPSVKTPSFIEVMRTNTWGDNKNILFLDTDVEKVDDSTPLSNATSTQVNDAKETEGKMAKNTYTIGAIGLAVGLGFAYYKKSGFWGYVGFGILGSVVAQIGYNVVSKKK
jgi:hypothetical protein